MSKIQTEVARIIAARALGRSPVYKRLLEYLADHSESEVVPREINIATDVFDRDNFDGANDSTVRVYLHNLRQKLDAFYADNPSPDGERLTIPKGDYRLEFANQAKQVETGTDTNKRSFLIPAALLLLATLGSFFAGRLTVSTIDTPTDELADSLLWQPFVDNDLPVTIVIGDYYVFAEEKEPDLNGRLIRDFSINNKRDLDAFVAQNPELSQQYQDVQLTYLPTGAGAALNDVLKVLHSNQKSVRVVPQSQFTASMMRMSHIIYVGYLSGMDSLIQYAFHASRLEVGLSYDELIDTHTDDIFQSRAGYIDDQDASYVDYGYLTAITGPVGNRFLFVTGMRDEGLMQMASIVANVEEINAIMGELDNSDSVAPTFETLYRVASQGRAHLSAERLFSEKRDPSGIWNN